MIQKILRKNHLRCIEHCKSWDKHQLRVVIVLMICARFYTSQLVVSSLCEPSPVCVEGATKIFPGGGIWWHSTWIDMAPSGWFKNSLLQNGGIQPTFIYPMYLFSIFGKSLARLKHLEGRDYLQDTCLSILVDLLTFHESNHDPLDLTPSVVAGCWLVITRNLYKPSFVTGILGGGLDRKDPLKMWQAFILGEPALRKYYTAYDWWGAEKNWTSSPLARLLLSREWRNDMVMMGMKLPSFPKCQPC